MERARRDEQGRHEDELVQRGLPLVQYVTSDIVARVPRSVARDDLVSAGQLGLAQAARSWDPKRGVTFECFARTRIRGAILDELRSRDWASRSLRVDGRRLEAATNTLTQELHRAPTTDELAAHLGVATDAIHRREGDLHRASLMSLDGATSDAGAGIELTTGEDPLSDLLKKEMKGALAAAITALPNRLRTVVVAYFFDERQMLDIAEELGVTESRVSQMRGEALALLKEGIATQMEPETMPKLSSLHGRVARRKAAYFAAVANASDIRSRLSASAERRRPALVRKSA